MLALVNGMDAVKSPNLMYGKEYKGHAKNKCISLEMLLLVLLFHYTTELGNHCSIHATDKSYHPLGSGDCKAYYSTEFGSQSRLLNS